MVECLAKGATSLKEEINQEFFPLSRLYIEKILKIAISRKVARPQKQWILENDPISYIHQFL